MLYYRNRKRTLGEIEWKCQKEVSSILQQYRTEQRIGTHYSEQHLSVIAKYILMLVAFLVINRLHQTEFTDAFTAPSFYQMPIRDPFHATTAGNAEMEYRQKSTPNNENDDDRSITNDDAEIYVRSWKEVPGGFVPQLGSNRAFKEAHPVVDQSTAANAVAQQIHNESSLPSLSTSLSSSSSPMKKNTTPTTMRIRQLSNIKDYKHYVVDDVDPSVVTITVVRFYAPWCRACQAIQQRYYRLAQQYEQRMKPQPPPNQEISTSTTFPRSSFKSSPSNVLVRFMECPVTKDNAMLHQGLGVPSLPYGHIYHSRAGLVEEMKLNKNVFTNFESTLASYVNGYCTVTYDNDDDVTINDTGIAKENHASNFG